MSHFLSTPLEPSWLLKLRKVVSTISPQIVVSPPALEQYMNLFSLIQVYV